MDQARARRKGRGIGATKAAALTAAVANLDRVAPDDEMLLVDRRNALICEIAVRAISLSRIPVRIDGSSLAASRQRPAVEAKGASLSELRVGGAEDGSWVTQGVVEVSLERATGGKP